MLDNGIRGNGTRIVTIDMGDLNCVDEPNIIDLGEGIKFLIRYKQTADKNDFGKLSFERLAS